VNVVVNVDQMGEPVPEGVTRNVVVMVEQLGLGTSADDVEGPRVIVEVTVA
jgi:hypothetical protein